MFARKMLEDNSCVCWSLKEISHFCATSTEASPETHLDLFIAGSWFMYMFLLPKTFWIVPSERLFFRKKHVAIPENQAQLHHQCVTTPQVDSLTNMTCIHTTLKSWMSFGTPYPTKIANKAGHTENSRVPLLSHHLREIPVEVTGGRVISH